jgi:uncharacterized protein YdhG (YjbR/CyaY superfamily)
MKPDFESVDEYIAAQPEAAQHVLSRVRNTIRKSVPAAEEMISYNMPTYKLHGDRLLYFAGWKRHYSLYPATKRLIEAFEGELGSAKIVKSTLQFSLAEPVPVKLIDRIAKFRAREVTTARERKAS